VTDHQYTYGGHYLLSHGGTLAAISGEEGGIKGEKMQTGSTCGEGARAPKTKLNWSRDLDSTRRIQCGRGGQWEVQEEERGERQSSNPRIQL